MKTILANCASTYHHLAQLAGRVIVLRLTSDNSTPEHCVERVKVQDDEEDEWWRLVLVIPSKVL